MILDSIRNTVKDKLGFSNKSSWITERQNELQNHYENNDTLPFKIVDIKTHGFLTKVLGLYSFVPFSFMPWFYADIDSWVAVAPSLINRKFYCKVHEFDKSTGSIILDAGLPQFKRAELIEGEAYKGLITRLSDFGVFIDIGYHFDWKCGSLLGLLHKSQLADYEELNDFGLGQEITTIYKEMNHDGKPVFCNDKEKKDWKNGKPQKLVGQTTWANAVRKSDNETVELFVEGKYKARLVVDKRMHSWKSRKEIFEAMNDLSHGEMLNCEVIGFNEKNRTLIINWFTEIDTEIIGDNSILNNLDDKTLEKLELLKSIIP
jgi:ribosomal protein S1